MLSLFFCELQLITILFLLYDSYINLKDKVRLSKTLWGIFHFQFRFIFIKVYIFVQQNA